MQTTGFRTKLAYAYLAGFVISPPLTESKALTVRCHVYSTPTGFLASLVLDYRQQRVQFQNSETFSSEKVNKQLSHYQCFAYKPNKSTVVGREPTHATRNTIVIILDVRAPEFEQKRNVRVVYIVAFTSSFAGPKQTNQSCHILFNHICRWDYIYPVSSSAQPLFTEVRAGGFFSLAPSLVSSKEPEKQGI